MFLVTRNNRDPAFTLSIPQEKKKAINVKDRLLPKESKRFSAKKF